MEPKRLGGALLTAVATGVGIMVPYTFKTMTPLLMAVIWSALVFAGVVGLVLALKPGSQPSSDLPPSTPPLTRKPMIDPDLLATLGVFFGIPLGLMSLVLIQRAFILLLEKMSG